MHLFRYIWLVLLLISCSSVQVVEKEVKVPVYIDRQDTLILKDSITVSDTIWYSNIVDSLKGVMGNLKVWYNKKIAELKLNYKDTVKIVQYDTIKTVIEKPITVISGLLPMWAEIILIVVGIALLTIVNKKIIKL